MSEDSTALIIKIKIRGTIIIMQRYSREKLRELN